MSEHDILSQMYADVVAQQEKTAGDGDVAEMELFAKMAAEQGIDLEAVQAQYGTQAVIDLYNSAFSKAAEEEGEKGEKHEEGETEKEEKREEAAKKAEAYVLERQADYQAAEEKRAEAENIGRLAARYFYDEQEKIAREHFEAKKLRPGWNQPLKPGHNRSGGGVDKARSVGADVAGKARSAAGWVGKNKLKAGLIGGGSAAALGGAAALAHHLSKKESAAHFDLFAAEHAVKMAAEAGWDADQAVDLLNQVLANDPPESMKIAAVGDVDSALGLRAAELLEMAGYTINW